MATPLPPFTWLRAFESAARLLSFTGAADELNVTQSAISQHIRSLEERIGKPLFVRKARGLVLTDDGRRLLPYVTAAVSELSSGLSVVAPDAPETVLHVAASISFAQLWLAPRLPDFQRDHPELGLRIVSALWSDDYLHTRADVELRYGTKEMVGADAVQLIDDHVVLYSTPTMAAAIDTWDDLVAAPLIHTVGTSDTWQTWSQHLGLTPPAAFSHSVDSYVLSMELARCGAGVALGSRFLGERLIANGDITMPLDLSAPARENHYITINAGSALRRHAETFRDWIFDAIGRSHAHLNQS